MTLSVPLSKYSVKKELPLLPLGERAARSSGHLSLRQQSHAVRRYGDKALSISVFAEPAFHCMIFLTFMYFHVKLSSPPSEPCVFNLKGYLDDKHWRDWMFDCGFPRLCNNNSILTFYSFTTGTAHVRASCYTSEHFTSNLKGAAEQISV